MAESKFQAMLHRSTNRFVQILVNAFLEWVLILLLLINSLFSYLIVKFADFFGLVPPCRLCSRVDHILDRKSNDTSAELVCEAHAHEISKLGYCSIHRKLAESTSMCSDCSSPSRSNCIMFVVDKDVGSDQSGDVDLKCSCCDLSLDGFNSRLVLSKHQSDEKVYPSPESGIEEHWVDSRVFYQLNFSSGRYGEDDGIEVKAKEMVLGADEQSKIEASAHENLEFVSKNGARVLWENSHDDDESVGNIGRKFENVMVFPKTFREEDEDNMDEEFLRERETASRFVNEKSGIVARVLQKISHEDDGKHEGGNEVRVNEMVLDVDGGSGTEGFGHGNVEFVRDNSGTGARVLQRTSHEDDGTYAEYNGVEVRENIMVLDADGGRKTEGSGHENAVLVREKMDTGARVLQRTSNEDDESVENLVQHLEFYIEDDHLCLVPVNEREHVVGKENHDGKHPLLNSLHQEGPPLSDNCTCNLVDVRVVEGCGVSTGHEDGVVYKPSNSAQITDIQRGYGETKEESGIYRGCSPTGHLQDLILHDTNDFLVERGVGGSAKSDQESHDLVHKIKDLESELKAERESVNVAYAELEQERSASAEAASHSMAKINMLHEEKAALQMKALQYQRIMEERSEYEKKIVQELERELNLCRKKIMDYEMKEKMALRRGNSTSNASMDSCAGDSDRQSVDSNDREEEDPSAHEESGIHITPGNAVRNLAESLAGLDEERLYNLEHLKVLEGKLRMVADEEEKDSNRQIHEHGDEFNQANDTDRTRNGFLANKGFHWEEENFESPVPARVSIEEEFDGLYDRLQALEADIEFLRHCIGSLKKGDKAINLLEEILHHLRNLRNVELRYENLSEGVLL